MFPVRRSVWLNCDDHEEEEAWLNRWPRCALGLLPWVKYELLRVLVCWCWGQLLGRASSSCWPRSGALARMWLCCLSVDWGTAAGVDVICDWCGVAWSSCAESGCVKRTRAQKRELMLKRLLWMIFDKIIIVDYRYFQYKMVLKGGTKIVNISFLASFIKSWGEIKSIPVT